jgi:hypothetical protein
MRLPFVTSGSMDVLIAALRSGGYLTDDASADAIRTAPAQISEADRDTLAGGLHYGSGGGGGGAGQLSSADDIWVLLDSDNTNPTTPYTNWFTIAKGQTGVPVTDPTRRR